MIGTTLPAGARPWLARQPFCVLAARTAAGGVRATILFGEPGFLAAAPDGSEVALASARAHAHADDPPWDALAASPALGLLALEFRSRRRLRVNGRARRTPDGISLTVTESYPNCPKYVRRRRLRALRPRLAPPAPARVGTELDE